MGQGLSKRPTVLIVEDDLDLRHLTTTLLEDEQLETIECESAEAALAIMLMRGRDIAMIFADVRLPGAMDGIDLALEVRLRWPLLPMILTSGHPCERAGDLPPGVGYMPKPWQPLNVLIAAEEALTSAR
jgi:DNA-binding NtrC family response regulator